MGRLRLLAVFGAMLALTSGLDSQGHASVSKADGNVTNPPITVVPTTPQSNTTVPEPSTSIKPQPPTPHTTPSTTSKPTLPTTAKPSPSTSSKPTSPPTTPTPSTTSKPTSPPTTPKPTPSPPTPAPPKPPANIDPPTGNWRVNYTTPTNASCIIAHMAIQFEVPYRTKNNQTWHAYVDVPKDANVTGGCADLTESLKLTWENNTVEFDFATKVNGLWYDVDKVNVVLFKNEKSFPNMDNSSQVISLVHAKSLFNTTVKMSYKCAKIRTYNLTMDNSNKTMGYMHIGHLQLQAFGTPNTTGFADAVDCEPAGTPDIVPIAAGCALAALIIIVLGVYLIGRKRSQTSGYLSMFTETKREEDYIPMKNLSCFN